MTEHVPSGRILPMLGTTTESSRLNPTRIQNLVMKEN